MGYQDHHPALKQRRVLPSQLAGARWGEAVVGSVDRFATVGYPVTSPPPPPPAPPPPTGGTPAGAGGGSGAATSVANAAGGIIAWVNGRSMWLRALLWLLLFWLLLPLMIINRTGGSRGGFIGAGVLLLTFLIIGAVGGEEPQDPETFAAVGDEQTQEPSPSAAPSQPAVSEPEPTPTEEPTPAPSPSSEEPPAPAAARADGAPHVYSGPVADVIDGDTFNLPDGTRVRIAIVDTPELSGTDAACGTEAADFVREFLTGEQITIYRPVTGPSEDSNGRLLGEVVRDDGTSLNVALVAAGLGTVDERFTSEDPDLAERLRDAAETAPTPSCAAPPEPEESTAEPTGDGSIDIATIRFDGPGRDVEPDDSEYVELRNGSGIDVDLEGWTLIDEVGNSVRIPAGFVIEAGSTFRVYTGPGSSQPTSRYYAGQGQAYLNNDGDTVRLLAPNGDVVDTYSY